MKNLTDRRRRIAKALPPFEEILRGSVVTRSLRCGKPGCRCAAGELHHATYLSVTLSGGRTEQISLPARLVPQARRWVANYLKWWKAVEEVSAVNRRLLRALRDTPAPPERSGGRPGKKPRRS
jgi:hypothetical protein